MLFAISFHIKFDELRSNNVTSKATVTSHNTNEIQADHLTTNQYVPSTTTEAECTKNEYVPPTTTEGTYLFYLTTARDGRKNYVMQAYQFLCALS